MPTQYVKWDTNYVNQRDSRLKLNIRGKLFLAFAVVGLIVSIVISGGISIATQKRTVEYLNAKRIKLFNQQAEQLGKNYQQFGDWSFIHRYRWHDQQRGRPPIPLIVLNKHHEKIFGRRYVKDNDALIAIKAEGNVVGYLAIPRLKKLSNKLDVSFLHQQYQIIFISSIGAVLIGLFASLIMAAQFSRPISTIRQLLQSLRNGHFSLSTPKKRTDEFQDIYKDCQRLAEQLASSREIQARMLADMAHEIRTPLTSVSGQVEAMKDGIRPCNIQNLNSLEEDLQHINKLIDSLHKLSQADEGTLQYQFNKTNLSDLIINTQNRYLEQAGAKGLRIELATSPDVFISGDRKKLVQLLDNLFSNSIRYTDAPGLIKIELSEKGLLTFSDSSPGPSQQDLAHIFERLYRSDQARSRTDGSGLGLAIVKTIAEGHRADISALKSEFKGLEIQINFEVIV